MTHTTQDKHQSAEERSQDTQRFVRQVRSATRRKYTAEEKIHLVLEGFRREVTVNELCRREGIKPNNFYSWTKEFMESGKQRLSRDTTRDATRQEINALKRESADLKLVHEVVQDAGNITGMTDVPWDVAQGYCLIMVQVISLVPSENTCG